MTVPAYRSGGIHEARLRDWTLKRLDEGGRGCIQEMSLPTGRTRADVVELFATHMVGYEIKSQADRFDRLASQIPAYESVFARCLIVVDDTSLEEAHKVVPPAWGILVASESVTTLRCVRRAVRHGRVETSALVQLLWKGEALEAARRARVDIEVDARREEIWAALVACLSENQLSRAVTKAIRERDPRTARFGGRWSSSDL